MSYCIGNWWWFREGGDARMKYAILAAVTILICGMCHMMFIMYDYALFHPDSGGLSMITEKMNNSLNAEYRNRTYNQTVMLRDGFGWGRIICIGLAPVLLAVEAFKRTRIEG